MKIKMSEYFVQCYASPLGFKEYFGECCELVEELINKDLKAAFEELKQVILYSLIIFYQMTKIDFTVPNCLPWQEDYLRFHVWKTLLAYHNLPFDIKWFSIGNNWRRPAKMQAIFKMAGLDINENIAKVLIKRGWHIEQKFIRNAQIN